MAKLKKDRKINIIDTTLRNGEKTAGVVFSKHEKIRIAKMLDEIGIPEIEVGTPELGDIETDMIKAVLKSGLNARIYAYCDAEIGAIESSSKDGDKEYRNKYLYLRYTSKENI